MYPLASLSSRTAVLSLPMAKPPILSGSSMRSMPRPIRRCSGPRSDLRNRFPYHFFRCPRAYMLSVDGPDGNNTLAERMSKFPMVSFSAPVGYYLLAQTPRENYTLPFEASRTSLTVVHRMSETTSTRKPVSPCNCAITNMALVQSVGTRAITGWRLCIYVPARDLFHVSRVERHYAGRRLQSFTTEWRIGAGSFYSQMRSDEFPSTLDSKLAITCTPTIRNKAAG